MSEYIQVAGKSDLFIGYADTPSALVKLGEQMDDTQIQNQQFLHDVVGDRHGGPQGPPIERQALGQIYRVSFALSRWDPEVREELMKNQVFLNGGAAGAQGGVIDDAEVGALLLRDRYFRVLVRPARDNTLPAPASYDPNLLNFVCCTISTPINWGQGTKHSILQFQMEAHRAPEGHPKAGIIYDRDTTGAP